MGRVGGMALGGIGSAHTLLQGQSLAGSTSVSPTLHHGNSFSGSLGKDLSSSSHLWMPSDSSSSKETEVWCPWGVFWIARKQVGVVLSYDPSGEASDGLWSVTQGRTHWMYCWVPQQPAGLTEMLSPWKLSRAFKGWCPVARL